MKNLILIITFLCFTTSLFSQESISVRTEIDTFTKANYEGQFDYVFARKEAKKQLFKLGGMFYPGNTYAATGNSFLEFAYERKLTKDMSINFSLGNVLRGDKIDNIVGPSQSFVSNLGNILKFGIEPRWYYTMKRDIKNGLISDNLNGNYIGLRTNINYSNGYVSGTDSYNLLTELTWGMQRRILRNQYLDFNIGAGILYRSNKLNTIGEPTKQTQNILNYRFTYGIILDNNLLKKKSAPNCDGLRCFEEEKSLWKVGLNNAFVVNSQNAIANLAIANEQKINNSQWSIETKVELSASKYKVSWAEGQIYGARFQVMPRFYWDLNKRIAKGESANNLSGKYVGLIMNYGVGRYKSSAIPANSLSTSNYDIKLNSAAIIPVIGFQKRLLNHLFIDANAGYGAKYTESYGKKGWKGGASANFTFGLSF